MTHDYKDDLYWIITNGHFDETDTAKLTECMQSIEHALQLAQQSVDLQKKAKKLRKERDEYLNIDISELPAFVHIPLPEGRVLGVNQKVQSIASMDDAYKCAEIIYKSYKAKKENKNE